MNSSSLDLLWEYNVNGLVSHPAVANDIVYFYSSRGNSTLYALNAINGNKIWEAPNYERTAPKIVKGIIYVGYLFNGPNENHQYIPSYGLHALDASNGKLIWNYTTEFWVYSPIVAGGAVYFVSNKNIYALNALTGIKLWNYSTNKVFTIYGQGTDYEFSSPTFTTGIIYIFSNRESSMLALKASNGAKIWNYNRAIGNPPIVANGAVYVDIEGFLCSLDAYNGSRIWASNLPVNKMNLNPPLNPTVINDVLYFSDGGTFYALKLPVSSSADMSPTILQALTDKGQTVNLTIGGNITSSQISNVYITSDDASSVIYFTLSGTSGNRGFSNMTVQKSLIPDGYAPILYIDDLKAENQGYNQDLNNYYVWYATDFSTHQISITFSAPQTSNSLTFSVAAIWLAVFILVIAVLVTVGLLVCRRGRTKGHSRPLQFKK